MQNSPVQATAAQIALPLWTADFILLMAANFLVFASFQMLLPTMPVYVQKLGATEDIVGFVTGIFTVTSVTLRPFAGRAIDSRGRWSVYLFGLATIVVSIIAYDLIPTVAMILLIRLMHGVGWGVATTASGTIATDVIPRARLGEGMGYYGLTMVVAMAVAPALGLQVMASLGFSALFYISSAVCVLGACCAQFITYLPVEQRRTDGGAEGRSALLEKRAFIPSILIFFTVYALALLIARPLFGRLIDRKGFDIAIIPGMLCIGLAMLTLFAAQGLPYFIAAAFLYGIGGGAVAPSLQAMAVIAVPPQRRGAANGTFMSGFDLGIGVGSILCGLVAKLTGYSVMYLLTLLPVTVAFALYFLLARKKGPSILS